MTLGVALAISLIANAYLIYLLCVVQRQERERFDAAMSRLIRLMSEGSSTVKGRP